MKISKKSLILILALILSTGLFGFSFAQPEEPPQKENPRVINVSGTGIISAKPDMGRVNLGIVTEETSANESQSKNNEISNKIIDSIKATGVNEENIQTIEYSINPIYKYEEGKPPIITGYQTVHMLNINVYDIEKIGAVIDAGTTAGANRVGGISFDIKDKKSLELKALEEAVKDARKKADTALAAEGEKVIKLISMNVGNESSPIMPPRSKSDLTGSSSTQLMPGQLEIVVTVSATFSF
jgi:uncharacterized protein YggE